MGFNSGFKGLKWYKSFSIQSCKRPDDSLYQAENSGLKICTVALCVTVYRMIYTEGKLFHSLLECRIIKKSLCGLKICVSFSHQSGSYGGDSLPVAVVILKKKSVQKCRTSRERGSKIFLLAQQPSLGQGLLIHEVSRSHTTTHHSR